MLVETAASLATPWPLKIIIDNVVGHHKMALWLAELIGPWINGKHQLHIAGLAAAAYVVIALLGALATHIDNYDTDSVVQYVAHELRLRMFHHLQRLSLGYYNTRQTGYESRKKRRLTRSERNNPRSWPWCSGRWSRCRRSRLSAVRT